MTSKPSSRLTTQTRGRAPAKGGIVRGTVLNSKSGQSGNRATDVTTDQTPKPSHDAKLDPTTHNEVEAEQSPPSVSKPPSSTALHKPQSSSGMSQPTKTRSTISRPDLTRTTASAASRVVTNAKSVVASSKLARSAVHVQQPARTTSRPDSRSAPTHSTLSVKGKEQKQRQKMPTNSETSRPSTKTPSPGPATSNGTQLLAVNKSSSPQDRAAHTKLAPPSTKTTTAMPKTSSKQRLRDSNNNSSSTPEFVSTKTSDPLQVAAQLYPWMYMTSSLETCMKEAEAAANGAFQVKEKELAAQEADIADKRIRFEIERVLVLYDELVKPELISVLPNLLNAFIKHGEECSSLSSEVLRLASLGVGQINPHSPLHAYKELSNTLDDASAQGTWLETSISKLLEEYNSFDAEVQESNRDSAQPRMNSDNLVNGSDPSDRANPYNPHLRIASAFTALISVLQARNANLAQAREVVSALKENVSAQLRVESLHLLMR